MKTSFVELFIAFILSFLSFNALSSENFTNEFGINFVKINAGSFQMGTQNFEALAKEVKPEKLIKLQKEAPVHTVNITEDFWLATTEVTQKVWFENMNSKPGKAKRWARDDWEQIPASNISWNAAQLFIDELNELGDGYHYRLPTEAEWEYAARAGTSGLRPFSFDSMKDFAWYKDNSNKKPQPVASLKPNAWGLHDMIGNVWEWVNDSYDAKYYNDSPKNDPQGASKSTRKVMRGGSYRCTTERVRVAIRGSYIKHRSMSILGFRIAASKIK